MIVMSLLYIYPVFWTFIKEIENPYAHTLRILQYVVPSLVDICDTVSRKQTTQNIALQLVWKTSLSETAVSSFPACGFRGCLEPS